MDIDIQLDKIKLMLYFIIQTNVKSFSLLCGIICGGFPTPLEITSDSDTWIDMVLGTITHSDNVNEAIQSFWYIVKQSGIDTDN